VIEEDGIKVLLVRREVAPILDRMTLDVQDTPDGPKLNVFKE